MLKRFSVKNFRNFKDELVFDLTTDKRYEFNENAVEGNIIRHAMVYGGNGEGKTNLGWALMDIAFHIGNLAAPESPDPSYLNADSATEMAEFCYLFELNGLEVEYRYGKTNYTQLIYESLAIDSQLMIRFDTRESSTAEINLTGTETLNKNISTNIVSVLQYILNNSNLSGNEINTTFMSLFKFAVKTRMLSTPDTSQPFNSEHLIQKLIIKVPGAIERLEQFFADLGVDCKLGIEEQYNGPQLVFKHKSKNLDFLKTASSGTKALTSIFTQLEQIDKGVVSFIYIDEFDAFYHQRLAKVIAKRITQSKVQTIFSTHNTGIMSNDILRPDCYFELHNGTVKPLYQLSDRELRKAHNLEKMYRSGTFDE